MVRIKKAPDAKSQSQLLVLVGAENTSFLLPSDYPVQKIEPRLVFSMVKLDYVSIYLFV